MANKHNGTEAAERAQEARTMQSELADALDGAGQPEAPEAPQGAEALAQTLASEALAKPERRLTMQERIDAYASTLPASVWPRLRRFTQRITGFGSSILKLQTPTVPSIKLGYSASHGRLNRIRLDCDTSVDTMIAGITGVFDTDGVCVGGVLKLQPSELSQFTCEVPTASGLQRPVYHVRLEAVTLRIEPAKVKNDQTEKPRNVVDPTFLNAILADRKVPNLHAAFADVLGYEYKRPE